MEVGVFSLPCRAQSVRGWLRALAYAAAYVDVCGRPIKAEHLLSPEAIERYLATGCGLSAALCGNLPSRLSQLPASC